MSALSHLDGEPGSRRLGAILAVVPVPTTGKRAVYLLRAMQPIMMLLHDPFALLRSKFAPAECLMFEHGVIGVPPFLP
jgi:hypothetical protein